MSKEIPTAVAPTMRTPLSELEPGNSLVLDPLALDLAPIRSLYIHVPFCAHKCEYCAFFSETPNGDLISRYVAALIRELELRTKTGASIVAIERAGANNVNPGPDEELQVNDQVLLLGNPAQLEKARKHLLETPG